MGNVEGIGDPQSQVRHEFADIQALVEAASGSLADRVELTAVLRHMSHRSIITGVRKARLRASFPTATMQFAAERRPHGTKISPASKVLHDRSFEEVVDRDVGEIPQVMPSAAAPLR
jgi:enamine deaminase RidA (YjgF/YER057c/UK114 family)